MPKGKRIHTFNDKIVQISYEEFMRLRNAPVQRNHEKRAKEKKHQDKLRFLKDYHRVVFAVKLTADAYDPTSGEEYPAGTIFLVDGHTRREYWNEYAEEYPAELIVHMKEVASIEEVRDAYYSHDAGDNVEKNTDLAYGATRSWGVVLRSELYKVMPVTWASHYAKSDEFPKVTGWKGNDFIHGYRFWKQELLFLNDITWRTTTKAFPASLVCAALIFLKANDLSAKSTSIVSRIWADDFQGRDAEQRLDAVTNIRTWLDKVATKDDLAHNFNTMPGLVERFCYWMEQAHKELDGADRLQKYGGRTNDTPVKDCLVKRINSGKLDLAA
jgi:hypothetical protein